MPARLEQSDRGDTIASVEYIQHAVLAQTRDQTTSPIPTIVRQKIGSKVTDSRMHSDEPRVFHLNDEGEPASSTENLQPGSRLVKVTAQSGKTPASEMR